MAVTEPGIYTMPDHEYHADPAPVPSLSRSIARKIIEASPAHAYAEHPRLGGSVAEGPSSGDEDMDVGTAAHALFLEGSDRVEHIPFDSYRTKDAKEMRDAALAAGRIPLKTRAYDSTRRVVEALENFRARTGLFTHGKPEQTLVWQEDDHWARARVDWLHDDPAGPLLDLKTTGGLATPERWGRQCFEFGADLQAAMYPRGASYLRDGEVPDGMLFVVVETSAPFAIRVFALDPVAVDVGEAKAAAARAIWVQCMAATRAALDAGRPTEQAWPSYPRETEWILPPPWIVRQWESAKAGGYGRAIEDTKFIERLIEAGQFGG
jgi:hypothetical protein